MLDNYPQPGVDTELILRIQKGDLDAFESLFNKYRGLIFRTALAITHDSGTAEEVLQDCFLRAYTNIEKINPEVPISPWLHRVAVNLSCNALKKRRWLEPLENIAERLFSDVGESPEGAAEHGELSVMLRQMIDCLPLKHRIVVVLHYLQEFSLPEIGYILDCPVGTVKSRLHYARQVLRVGLEKEYGRPAPRAGEVGLGVVYETSRL